MGLSCAAQQIVCGKWRDGSFTSIWAFPTMSALHLIVLQNSKVEGLRIFLENAKRETIADSYNLNRVSEVACEFTVRRCGPSHLYTKTAPVARRIFDHQCKTSFATQSSQKRTFGCAAANAALGHEPPPALQKNRERFRCRPLVKLVTDLPIGTWYCSRHSIPRDP